jgi:glycerophosphoryl diester phosphodiesterase
MAKKIALVAFGTFIAFVLFQLFYGGSPDDIPPGGDFEVVAHRGVHLNYRKGTYDPVTGCEAEHIYEPTHAHIENTIESIGAAFAMGATIVEIDIRRSSDDQVVVFHDYLLECRTDGTGEIGDHPLEYLQGLDIGYGYTHDDGQTYPFRGKGVGKMPTLVEVLQEFPDGKFLIHHKDGSTKTAELLVDIIQSLPPHQRGLLTYYGPDETYEHIHGEIPAVMRLFGTRPQVKRCFLPYLLTFGLSGFPEECAGLGIGLPVEYTRFAWGWPYRFLKGVREADARFYLMVDTEKDAQAFSGIPVDGIVTDYVEVVGRTYAR